MATVKHLVDSKTDSTHYAVKANETVLKALRVMASATIGSVLVMDEGMYRLAGRYGRDDTAHSKLLQGFHAAVAEILG